MTTTNYWELTGQARKDAKAAYELEHPIEHNSAKARFIAACLRYRVFFPFNDFTYVQNADTSIELRPIISQKRNYTLFITTRDRERFFTAVRKIIDNEKTLTLEILEEKK
jgi:hypothetical protein